MTRKVLLVDDDTNLLDALALTLRDFDVEKETDPCNALEKLTTGSYAVVISDVRMPVLEGPALLRMAMIEAPDTIRLILTGHGDMQTAMTAINSSGVYRFMQKPVAPEEICRAVSDALEEYEQRAKNAALQHNALHDELTGMANRMLFQEHGRTALARAKRFDRHIALLFLDMDKFKAINDIFGHEAGDKVLTVTATRILSRIRENDTAARFGGDEFVIMLSDLERERDAMIVGNELLNLITEPIFWKGHRLEVGASIGIGVYPAHGETIDTVLTVADEAMYRAKRNGGNCVIFAECNQP